MNLTTVDRVIQEPAFKSPHGRARDEGTSDLDNSSLLIEFIFSVAATCPLPITRTTQTTQGYAMKLFGGPIDWKPRDYSADIFRFATLVFQETAKVTASKNMFISGRNGSKRLWLVEHQC
jgi:hypothetical protein